VIPLLYRPFKQPAYRAKGLWPAKTKRQLVRSIYIEERRHGKNRPLRDTIFDLRYAKGWPAR